MLVTLTAEEVADATRVGRARHDEARSRGRKDKHGAGSDGLDLHTFGAIGECAVAKALKIPWSKSINTFKSVPDVGEYEVRRRAKQHWDLIIRDDDDPDRKYVLVVGDTPILDVVGWVFGRDGMKGEFRRSYGGREEAWFVPQRMLRRFIGPNRFDDFTFDEPEPYPGDYAIGDNSYLKAFLEWVARRRAAKHRKIR